MKEFDSISEKLKEKAGRFRMSNDLAIVANAHEVFDLQRKVKNNNFEGKRLELEDEEPLAESVKLESSPETFEYGTMKKKLVEGEKKPEDRKVENDGEHVFFVQLDSELPMPQFMINISKEKKKIETIGSIKNSFFSTKEENNDVDPTEHSNTDHDLPLHFRPPIPRPQFKNNFDEVKEFMNNYQGYSSSFYTKPTAVPGHQKSQNLSYNGKVADPPEENPAVSQRVIESTQAIVNSDFKRGKEMFWFKWDSFDTWKYDFAQDSWNLIEGVRPSQKFLYFSNV